MKKLIFAMFLSLFALQGCSWNSGWNPFYQEPKPENEERELPCNPYLWQAMQKKLSFMPKEKVDVRRCMIVTDWSRMDDVSNEHFKISARVVTKSLRADGLDLKIEKRVMHEGKWVDLPVTPSLVTEIDKEIVGEARSLYRENTINRKN